MRTKESGQVWFGVIGLLVSTCCCDGLAQDAGGLAASRSALSVRVSRSNVAAHDRAAAAPAVAAAPAAAKDDFVEIDLSKDRDFFYDDASTVSFWVARDAILHGQPCMVKRVTVAVSEDREYDESKDPTLLDLRLNETTKTGLQFNAACSVVGEGSYLLARFEAENIYTPIHYRWKVRRAGPYWKKLSLGGALALHKSRVTKDSSENELNNAGAEGTSPGDGTSGGDVITGGVTSKRDETKWELTPSPLLYTAVGWSWSGNSRNYYLPRSIGVLFTPDAINVSEDKDLLPLLTLGVGLTLLDDKLLLGVAWDLSQDSEEQQRYVVGFNALDLF